MSHHNNNNVLTLMALGGAATIAAIMMMPKKETCEIEDGMRKAADELAGVSKELGKAIKSIGQTIA